MQAEVPAATTITTAPVCGAQSCTNPASLSCSACKGESYCSRECQKKAWSNGHKTLCKSVQMAKALLDDETPTGKRILLLNSSNVDRPKDFDFILQCIPEFYAGLLGLIQKDVDNFSENEHTGINEKRFLAFIRSDPSVWPTFMRLIVLFARTSHHFSREPNVRRTGCELLRVLCDAIADRHIAAFVLENHCDLTTNALRSVIKDDDRYGDEEYPVGLQYQPLFFQFAGVLDTWGALFYIHRLPGSPVELHGVQKSIVGSSISAARMMDFFRTAGVYMESITSVNDPTDVPSAVANVAEDVTMQCI